MQPTPDFNDLKQSIGEWGRALGFSELRVADTVLKQAGAYLSAWLREGHHGEMTFLEAHGDKRYIPEKLVPGTQRIIMVRMDYLNEPVAQRLALEKQHANDPKMARIALYARGRDYHRVLRQRLQQLADHIQAAVPECRYRVFVDSAPVMEVALAEKAGLGWRGKQNLLLNRQGGSFFFLGALYLNLPLPVDEPVSTHCGRCDQCIQYCPTGAITAPWQIDARRCIAYLTIEYRGSIPLALRPLIGNRVFGCDDCQLVCPWNSFAQVSVLHDFKERYDLGSSSLRSLFQWDEATFDHHTQGSAIRRVGYTGWLRNLAVAMGNALRVMPDSEEKREMRHLLQLRLPFVEALVQEHIQWALAQDSGNQREYQP